MCINQHDDVYRPLIARHWPQKRRLVQVLPDHVTPDADIHAVYPPRHQLAARVRAFVDFIKL